MSRSSDDFKDANYGYQRAHETDVRTVRHVRSRRTSRHSVTASATSTLIVDANDGRNGVSIFNDAATATLYLLVAGSDNETATTDNYDVKILAGGYWESPFDYSGKLFGIWSAAPGVADRARVVEYTRGA